MKVPVIGGRAGQPWKVPNPAVKQGYSLRRPYWRLAGDLPSEVVCGGEVYRLIAIGDKRVYSWVGHASDEVPEPAFALVDNFWLPLVAVLAQHVQSAMVAKRLLERWR